jgi:uroporphyrin-III C-methyltransferase
MAHIALIGAGPGAADLITVRGLRLLQQAQCILHDALVSEELLAMANPQAVLIPVGKRCGKLSTAQHFINKQLVDAARKYERVVRLKGGDPMVFGRADEEMTALREAGFEFEVVPGITTALAAASELQTSLTLRGVSRSVALLTPAVGHGEQPHAMADDIPGADTLAVYMGLKQAAVWAVSLLAAGKAADTPVILAESVSQAQQQFTALTLNSLAQLSSSTVDAQREGPCLILIGEALRARHAALSPFQTNDEQRRQA